MESRQDSEGQAMGAGGKSVPLWNALDPEACIEKLLSTAPARCGLGEG